jgi:MFS superfamily sulfate permease-like transporter
VLPSAGLDLEQLAGVVVYMLEAPLWFANADHVAARIRALAGPGTGVDSFVLDAAAISDVDYTAGRQLIGVVRDLTAAHVRVGVARASAVVTAELQRIGLGGELGPGSFFPTVDEAVQALVGARGTPGPAGSALP